MQWTTSIPSSRVEIQAPLPSKWSRPTADSKCGEKAALGSGSCCWAEASLFCRIWRIIIWDAILLMHFVWHLIFVEHVRGEAPWLHLQVKGGGETRVEKGHFPALEPGQRYSAPSSLGQLWAVQHSIQTAPGPGAKPSLSSVPELLRVEKSAKHLRTKV